MYIHINLGGYFKMSNNSVIRIKPLGFPWDTSDPFLFCAYHADHYPKGNDQLGPDPALLAGRQIGQDFQLRDGWRMYHGRTVPGFPSHPHRGFETISIVTEGLVDHSDSLGAAGRFGNGDVQWMTAGKGVQHCEMFPLLDKQADNPLEMFQIWLNLPKKSKMVEPHFKMLWNEDIPLITETDGNGGKTTIKLVTGGVNGHQSYESTPDSWAHDPYNAVTVLTVKMEPNAQWTINPLEVEKVGEISQSIYFYAGSSMTVDGQQVQRDMAVELDAARPTTIVNGDQDGYFLFLQGRAIQEPVAKYGPFVMNSQQEIMEAMDDYRRTEFGGWPWGSHDHVHGADRGRFALHADGREEVKK